MARVFALALASALVVSGFAIEDDVAMIQENWNLQGLFKKHKEDPKPAAKAAAAEAMLKPLAGLFDPAKALQAKGEVHPMEKLFKKNGADARPQVEYEGPQFEEKKMWDPFREAESTEAVDENKDDTEAIKKMGESIKAAMGMDDNVHPYRQKSPLATSPSLGRSLSAESDSHPKKDATEKRAPFVPELRPAAERRKADPSAVACDGMEGYDVARHLRLNGYEKIEGGTHPGQFRTQMRLAREVDAKKICETGFNFGASALAFLCSNKDASVMSYDIGEHKYVQEAKKFIQATFQDKLGHKLNVELGDSKDTLKNAVDNLGRAGTCDMSYVDGGRDLVTLQSDIARLALLTKTGGRIVVANCNRENIVRPPGGNKFVNEAYIKALADGVIQHDQQISENCGTADRMECREMCVACVGKCAHISHEDQMGIAFGETSNTGDFTTSEQAEAEDELAGATLNQKAAEARTTANLMESKAMERAMIAQKAASEAEHAAEMAQVAAEEAMKMAEGNKSTDLGRQMYAQGDATSEGRDAFQLSEEEFNADSNDNDGEEPEEGEYGSNDAEMVADEADGQASLVSGVMDSIRDSDRATHRARAMFQQK